MVNNHRYKKRKLDFSFGTVKTLSLILLLYVLQVSSDPCCENDLCASIIHSTKTEQTNNHQESNDNEGACSPFFTCGNCTGFSFPISSFSLIVQSNIVGTLISNNQSSFSSEILCSIWQPPKFS